jgi:DNA polymerase elongation subunit (family B)
MILEIDMRPNCLDVSYLDKNGNKLLRQFPVNGYTQWQIDQRGVGTPGYIDITGKPVYKQPSKSFRRFDLLEFMKTMPKDIQDELFAYREANLIASDIETEIGDRFPVPELAEQPINCISAIDKNMNMIVYTTLDCMGETYLSEVIPAEPEEPGAWQETKKTSFADLYKTEENPDLVIDQLMNEGYDSKSVFDWPTGNWFKKTEPVKVNILDEINRIVKTHVGHLIAPHEKVDVKLFKFDTEEQMLRSYYENVVKFAPVITFWNGFGFDVPYLANRCIRNGINIASGSLTHEIATQTNTPKHTVFTDYMELVEKHASTIKNKESLKLDYIGTRVLGVGKLPYRGTLKDMMVNDIPGFIAYNVIDSIIVQLIHRKLNLMAVLYGFATVCKLPLSKADSQVAQTESLISLDTLDMLDLDGIPNMPPRPEFGAIPVAAFDRVKPPRRQFAGGHVKQPHTPIGRRAACLDYSGLYPSLHRSFNISYENYIGNIDQFDSAQQKAFHSDKNFYVSINNNVYRNDRPYAYKRIQIYLRSKRDFHKNIAAKHLEVQQPFIELALYERGLWHEKPIVDKEIKELPYAVHIGGNTYTPDLAHLCEKLEDGSYEHHQDFIWFLFHTNLGEGFFHFNLNTAYKLVANSLYGATANEFNGYNNVEVADDTTAEGRNGILCAQSLINNWFNFEWHTDIETHEFLLKTFPGQLPKLVPGNMPQLKTRDRILYIDTDSLYVEFGDIIDDCGYTGDMVDFFHHLYTKHLGKIVNQRLAYMVNSRHGESMMKFDLEYILSVGTFCAKKMYAFAMAAEGDRKFAEPTKHIKFKGMAIARSFMPERCRAMAKHIVEQMFAEEITTREDYVKAMLMAWQEFQTYPLEDISKRISISRDMYDKYISGDTEENLGWRSRALPQYRGAMFMNYWIQKLGMQDRVELVKDGYVCNYFDTNGNPFSYRLYECPDFAPEPDYAIMFVKVIEAAVNRFAKAFGIWQPLNLGANVEPDDQEDTDDEQ